MADPVRWITTRRTVGVSLEATLREVASKLPIRDVLPVLLRIR
jgi:hypothetical protein